MVEGEVAKNSDVTTPRAKLMTDAYPLKRDGKPWLKVFQGIENELNRLKNAHSLPFDLSGARLIPRRSFQLFMDRLYGPTLGSLTKQLSQARQERDHVTANRLEAEINASHEQSRGFRNDATRPVYDKTKLPDEQSIAYKLFVASLEFCQDWENIRAQIAAANTMFDKVEKRVPRTAAEMANKFSVDVLPIELAGNSPTELTADDLALYKDVVEDAVRRRVTDAIETMVEAPRQQLATALTNLQELISRDGRIRSTSFAPVREAIAKIREFDFVADADLLNQITALETRMERTNPVGLDSETAAANGFSAALTNFMEHVTDTDRMQADIEEFGFRRCITL